jgi:DNA-binding CsgD family transcriptional regulator
MIRMTGAPQAGPTRNMTGSEGPPPGGPFDEILSCLNGPLLVINEGLQIVNANAKAFEVLDCAPDQTDFGRFILGDAPSKSQEMRKRAQAALASGARVVLLLRHPRHRRLVCSIKSVRAPGSAEDSYGLATLLPLGEPSSPAVPFLRDIYRLSKAEADIALSAAAGAEVCQIAMDRHVSIHTMRAQIASIKIKMGLTRMTEIAVAVARIDVATTLI